MESGCVYNDEGKLDEAGNVIHEGFRKRDVSKEKRSEPIAQMGLFIDTNGLPVAYRLFPDNRVDQTTLSQILQKALKEELGIAQ